MNVTFFSSPINFRKWLTKNHKKENEIIVGYYKVKSGKPSMTWSQSVDVALCFGWIDSVRKSIDESSYCIRFTPRKPTSIWSKININKVEQLIKLGLMKPEGLKAFELRKKDKTGIYSHEKEPYKLSKEYEKIFSSDKIAWKFFNNQKASYKKVIIHWIMSAKKESTQISRLEKTINSSNQLKLLF